MIAAKGKEQLDKKSHLFADTTRKTVGLSLFSYRRGVAQLVEHWSPKPGVAGSSPVSPAKTLILKRTSAEVLLFGMM